MSYYNPDKWMLVKIDSNKPHYRVFGSWVGGYLGSDSWRMNSGINSMIEEDDHYLFIGSSGSTYACHKDMYGATSYGMSVALEYKEQMHPSFIILDEVDATDVINKNEWVLK
jgi:hypothetical protein